METRELVALLEGGVSQFNDWREQNPDEEICFRGADLRWANLQGTNLRWTDCQRTNFQVANCQRADFWRAKCQKADFRGADCQGADFRRANLQGANLQGADVSNTILDKSSWFPPLLALWNNACIGRRVAFVSALRKEECLRREWMRGTLYCPEGYLLKGEEYVDQFTTAWDTCGI